MFSFHLSESALLAFGFGQFSRWNLKGIDAERRVPSVSELRVVAAPCGVSMVATGFCRLIDESMRFWGIAISVFYALAVAGLLLPAALMLSSESWPSLSSLQAAYTDRIAWLWAAIMVGGQALLLFLSVDGSHKYLKRRQHVAVSVILAGLLALLLTFAAVTSLIAAAFTEGNQPAWVHSISESALAWALAIWLVWAAFFYFYLRESSQLVNRLAAWLLRGSVLELLIAVPCHLIVRQRNDCTSPAVTSFGVVTGVAVMLLAFGPSVLLLYKKRLEQYEK